uniref:Complex III subunit 9 n=1 Tax=Cajanus cajan TaxID=3821 RepID=A0A151TVL8_CAJCA|nr:Cytochrome b-c1 complex subunit 9 [Cajanus cajan]
MESISRRRGGGIFESLYKVVMRRNSVYVTFIIAGAFLGERAVDYGVHKLWEANNVGVMNLLDPMVNLIVDFIVHPMSYSVSFLRQ